MVFGKRRSGSRADIGRRNGTKVPKRLPTEAATRRGNGFGPATQRRVRYWADGAIIGSKSFVRDVASTIMEPARAKQGKAEAGVYSRRLSRLDV